MRRPLCCVCVAFVVTVFLYLKFCPLPEPVHDYPEGERITLLGDVYKKEFKSGSQGNALVVELENVQRWSPDLAGKETEIKTKTKGGKVLCYLEADENLTVPKAGSTIAVEGKVSCFDRAGNPGNLTRGSIIGSSVWTAGSTRQRSVQRAAGIPRIARSCISSGAILRGSLTGCLRLGMHRS